MHDHSRYTTRVVTDPDGSSGRCQECRFVSVRFVEKRMEHKGKSPYTVEVDTELCSLCEVCAHRCPTGALSIERDGKDLRLLFRHELCNGCPGGKICQEVCPEKAIRLVERGDTVPATGSMEVVILAQSEMLKCEYCGEYFAPVQKVSAVSKRSGGKKELIRNYCPLCRRTQMVVQFIDEKRMPTGKAEYRSGTDILRRAKDRAESEKKDH